MEPLLLLLAGLLPLLVAPLIARRIRQSPLAVQLFDGLVACVVIAIAGIFLLPEAWHLAGSASLILAALGFIVPTLIHRWLHQFQKQCRPSHINPTFTLAFAGLALHAALDGIALFAPLAAHAEHGLHMDNAWGMALGIILHRLPLAVAIWWMVSARLGQRAAIALLTSIGLATLIGFALGAQVWQALPLFGIGLMQALIAGMLLHVIAELHGPALTRSLIGGWQGLRRARTVRQREL